MHIVLYQHGESSLCRSPSSDPAPHKHMPPPPSFTHRKERSSPNVAGRAPVFPWMRVVGELRCSRACLSFAAGLLCGRMSTPPRMYSLLGGKVIGAGCGAGKSRRIPRVLVHALIMISHRFFSYCPLMVAAPPLPHS